MLTKKEIEIEIELQIGIEIKAEIMKTGLEIRENIKTTPLIMISKEKVTLPHWLPKSNNWSYTIRVYCLEEASKYKYPGGITRR